MATSTVPALKAALLTRLQADAALAGVTVSWGLPFGNLPRELVMLGNATVTAPDSMPGHMAMGLGERQESYVLEVKVLVALPADQQAVTERAFELAAVVEASLRAWAPEFGSVVSWALVTGSTLEEFVNPNGSEREADVTLAVACSAEI